MGMLSAVGGIVGLISRGGQESRFETLLTAEYRLDYYDTLSGYKFVVLSDPLTELDEAAVRADFERLYSLLFVPLVIRNPLFDPARLSGNLNDSSCHVFVSELRNHFQSSNPPATLAPQTIYGQSPSSVQLSPMVMTTLRDVSITPPRSLVEAKEATIIVSKKRPVVVYFEKAMELVTSKILAPLPPGKTYPDIEIRLVGAGGAIPRCQQVARYVVQEVRKKFKHLIKTVEKRLEATKNAVSVIDISLPADTPMEDAYLDAETSERFVNTCTVTIVVRI